MWYINLIMATIKTFEDLECWQEARKFATKKPQRSQPSQ
jgi:hypothetical protein